MPSETWYDEATQLVTGPRPQSDAEVRRLAEASLRLLNEVLIEEVNGRLAGLPELLQGGATVTISFVPGQDGYEDEGGGVTEPVDEGYHATLHDTEGRQIGEGHGSTPNAALAAARIPDPSEFSDETPFDPDDLPRAAAADPGEFPAV